MTRLQIKKKTNCSPAPRLRVVETEQKQLSRPELAASDLIALQSSRRLTFLTELSAAELELVWVIKQE